MSDMLDEYNFSKAERFVTSLLQEPFDYTEWRNNNLMPDATVQEVHNLASAHYRQKNQ
jgi:hypothetical protein